MAQMKHRPSYDRAMDTLTEEVERLKQRRPERADKPTSAWWRRKQHLMEQVRATLAYQKAHE